MLRRFLVLLIALMAVAGAPNQKPGPCERAALKYLNDLEPEILARKNEAAEVNWAYASNLTEHNLQLIQTSEARHFKFYKDVTNEVRKYDYKNFKDADLKRRVGMMATSETLLPADKFNQLLDAISRMSENYAMAKACEYNNSAKCDLSLEPELTEIFAKSRDPEELKHYWVQWYDAAGAPTRKDFMKYVELSNEAAVLNNYTSAADPWLIAYEDETFEQQVDAVMEEIRPMYEQIHGYVRHKLREYYGEGIVSEKGPIPMHLLGNMWGQTWVNVADITTPFPESRQLDVTEEMVRQGYTPKRMFEMGDDFFVSLNMTKLPQSFWQKSILEKPTDGRELVCQARAWQFYKKDDVRIMQCTRVNMEDFLTVHLQLGFSQYYLQYQHQPSQYREGANPAFLIAVGDLISLSVSSPKHLQAIGLLKDFTMDETTKFNQFYLPGLSMLVFLPFAYVIDKYRMRIFRGDIQPHEYNCKFWEMRSMFCGIEPPVVRTEKDFDAPAKYHVSADVEYMRFLVSYIIQFQFHRAACELAGEYVKGDPEKTLNNCDIYRSVKAGNAIKEMMAMGSSKPWPDAMEMLTGQRKMSADALVEYFKPLYDWLVVENKRVGAYVGWEPTDKCRPK